MTDPLDRVDLRPRVQAVVDDELARQREVLRELGSDLDHLVDEVAATFNVREIADLHGFDVASLIECVTRYEAGVAVPSWAAALRAYPSYGPTTAASSAERRYAAPVISEVMAAASCRPLSES